MPPRRLCLVTGASSGIGASLARVYAANGYDLALTARRTERLEALAAELRGRHGIEVLTIPADLAQPGAADAILKAVARPVAALVNNAGYDLDEGEGPAPWDWQAAMLQVMLRAVCELTGKVLPQMQAAGFGRVLNVASVAGLLPGSAGSTLYGPVKAFLVHYSQSLHMRCRGTGVHVSALCPGLTHTELHELAGVREAVERLPGFMWSKADDVALAGYRACEADRPVCVPGLANKVIVTLARVLPTRWMLGIMAAQPRSGAVGRGHANR